MLQVGGMFRKSRRKCKAHNKIVSRTIAKHGPKAGDPEGLRIVDGAPTQLARPLAAKCYKAESYRGWPNRLRSVSQGPDQCQCFICTRLRAGLALRAGDGTFLKL